jgi:hypothetical protein
MKSCDGCRYLFEGKFFENQARYCRARPPTMRITQDGQTVSAESVYPLAPGVRCGLFERRILWWRRDKAS